MRLHRKPASRWCGEAGSLEKQNSEYAQKQYIPGELEKSIKERSPSRIKREGGLSMSDISDLKYKATGQWISILHALASQLAQACERPGRHVPCPVHGGKDGFRLFKDVEQTGGGICNTCGSFSDGFDLLMWISGWKFPEAVDAVKGFLGMSEGVLPPSKTIRTPAPTPGKDWSVERDRLKLIWKATILDNGRIRQYLESRGLSVEVPPTLRLYPSLRYYHQGPEVHYLTMVARIQSGNDTVGLHFTYLDVDGPGKASVSQPRKIRKCVESISGGAIQLFKPEAGEPLILCEGIETSLAAQEMMALPAWSCLNAGMLENVKIPDSVSEVVIAGDLDRNNRGQKATERLAERLHSEGKRVKIALPPGPIPDNSKSIDWLDMLVKSKKIFYA